MKQEAAVLDELLQMDLTEDVFEQILELLEREQHSNMGNHRRIHAHPNTI